MTKHQEEFLANLQQIRDLGEDEITRIQEDLLANLGSESDSQQDEWFIYRGAIALVPQLLADNTPACQGTSVVYSEINVYKRVVEACLTEYHHSGVIVNSANDNAYALAA